MEKVESVKSAVPAALLAMIAAGCSTSSYTIGEKDDGGATLRSPDAGAPESSSEAGPGALSLIHI